MGDDRCRRGHLRTAENTYIRPDGSRQCRTCKRGWNIARSDNDATYRQRRRARQLGRKRGTASVEYNRKYRRDLKIAALNAYGGPVCVGSLADGSQCGEREIDKLGLDHVNDDGRRDRLQRSYKKTSTIFYRTLQRLHWPKVPALQVLCLSCNQVKRWAAHRAATDSAPPVETRRRKGVLPGT